MAAVKTQQTELPARTEPVLTQELQKQFNEWYFETEDARLYPEELLNNVKEFIKQLFVVQQYVQRVLAAKIPWHGDTSQLRTKNMSLEQVSAILASRTAVYTTALAQIKLLDDLFFTWSELQDEDSEPGCRFVVKLLTVSLLEYIPFAFPKATQHFQEKQVFKALNFLIRKWKELAELPSFVHISQLVAAKSPQQVIQAAGLAFVRESQAYIRQARARLSPVTDVIAQSLERTRRQREARLVELKQQYGPRYMTVKPIILFVACHGSVPFGPTRMLTLTLPANVTVGKISGALPGYVNLGSYNTDNFFTQVSSWYTTSETPDITLTTVEPFIAQIKSDPGELVPHMVPTHLIQTSYLSMRYLPGHVMLEKTYSGDFNARADSAEWKITMLTSTGEHVLLSHATDKMTLTDCIKRAVDWQTQHDKSVPPLVDILLIDLSCATIEGPPAEKKRKRGVEEGRYDEESEEHTISERARVLKRQLTGGVVV